jgi:hypothetical protein
MLRKLAGYMLLTFLSFGVFTTLFHTVVSAQTSALIAAPTAAPPISPVPTPTILQKTAPKSTVKFTLQSIDTPVTTPTPAEVDNISEKAVVTPSATPIPTIVPTSPIAAPTTAPLPTATPAPQPSVAAPADLEPFFTKYAEEFGVDKEDMIRIAKCEASFNSQADNGLYAGMFQFGSQTWVSNRSAMGLDSNPDLRKNAEESIRTAAFMIKNGNRGAWPNC